MGSPRNSLAQRLWESRGVRFIDLRPDEIPNFIRAVAARVQRPQRTDLVRTKVRRLFISHSRSDSELAQTAKEVAQSAGYDVLSFDDTPSMGRTIYEKFQELVDSASAAVVIVESTKSIQSAPASQSRQNTSFELGLLVGKLGIDRVLVVTSRESVRFPTDIAGMRFLVANPEQSQMFAENMKQWLENTVI